MRQNPKKMLKKEGIDTEQIRIDKKEDYAKATLSIAVEPRAPTGYFELLFKSEATSKNDISSINKYH
ncbi:MAG: hypothetical protein COA58_04290 [Bacteroidetes bacterium]|nr:MAG: hypothetical protein COA58_04290 [Bacteroidota bacterium]